MIIMTGTPTVRKAKKSSSGLTPTQAKVAELGSQIFRAVLAVTGIKSQQAAKEIGVSTTTVERIKRGQYMSQLTYTMLDEWYKTRGIDYEYRNGKLTITFNKL